MLSLINLLLLIDTKTLYLALSFKSTIYTSAIRVEEVKPNFLGLMSLKSFLKALMVSLITEAKLPRFATLSDT